MTNCTTAERRNELSSLANTSTLLEIFVSINLSLVENPSKRGGILIADYGRVLYIKLFPVNFNISVTSD